MVYNKNPCIEASFVCPTSIQALGVDFKHHTGPQWPWYEDTIVEAGDLYRRHRQWFMTKTHVFRLVLLVRRQLKHWCLVYNTTLGPSGHGMKPSSSRLRTLYSCYRQWFMIEINVLRLVLFIDINSSVVGWFITLHRVPSGQGNKPPSSRLGTLCSRYRQRHIDLPG